jgi:hypothetical protein
MAEEKSKSRFEKHEKKEKKDSNSARSASWEDVGAVFLFPVLIFAALFGSTFE